MNKMISYAYQCSHALLNLLIPPFCTVCRVLLVDRAILCVTCIQKVRPIVSHALTINKKYTVNVYALSDYCMPLKKLIVAKRYGNSVASRQLGRLMALRAPMHLANYDALVPIPLHWFRYMQRGYNQAEEIANEVSKVANIPVFDVLRRSRHTPYQTGLSKEDRKGNIKNAFTAVVRHKKNSAGKRVLLIDDVMTTGETIRAAAQELAKLHPAAIDVFVACRVV